jgi:hypothetical protein
MILYSAKDLTDAEIAERLDCTPECVGKWRRRFCEHRLAGLADGQRAGRPRRFPPEQVAEVKAIAGELPAIHGLPLSRFTRTELHRLVIEKWRHPRLGDDDLAVAGRGRDQALAGALVAVHTRPRFPRQGRPGARPLRAPLRGAAAPP